MCHDICNAVFRAQEIVLNRKVRFVSIAINTQSPKVVNAICASLCYRYFVIHLKFRFFRSSATQTTPITISYQESVNEFFLEIALRLGVERCLVEVKIVLEFWIVATTQLKEIGSQIAP